MTDPTGPKPTRNLSSSSSIKIKPEMGPASSGPKYPNPPESVNPNAATIQEQWRYAIRQYAKWYSHAWGTAIFAGVSFFALGWYIKGENPLNSLTSRENNDKKKKNNGVAAEGNRSG